MRIIFKDPTNPTELCVTRIDSAEINNITKHLNLHGSFKNQSALFRIPLQASTAQRLIECLYDTCKLNLCSGYFSRIERAFDPIVIDFFKVEGR